ADKSGFVVFPYLQFATPTSIVVMWETASPGTSVVRYGLASPAKAAEGAKDATMHEVALAGLEPGKPHVYQVETVTKEGKVRSPLLTFQTAVGPEEAWSFVLFGDTQRNPKVTHQVAKLAWDRRPNFVVHLGDVVDAGADKRQWTGDLFGPARELLSRVPMYPCIGNHERNHANYYKYFSLPAPEYFYKFRYGNADFFSLDTNKKVGPGSEQYKWLDAELARSDAKWKFCFHHHPAYSSDADDYGNTWKGAASKQGDPNARQLAALYEKHGVDMAFNGHIHAYERTWPLRGGKVDRAKGVTYLTSGGGGGKLEDFAPVPTWFKAQCRSDYHFCHIAIHGGRFSLRAFDKDGILFDTVEQEK
ncbi:MAG: metallophosphoesterase family protein, partial [Gemmataceae bacterium]|nr:metallophosphoesterase family protein [Gemmataceae bacterium]